MTYTLRAIPDQHPAVRFQFLLKESGFGQAKRDAILSSFFQDYIRDPLCVLSRDYWDTVESNLFSCVKEYDKRFVISRELELIRRIYQYQFGVIDGGDFKRIYQEGCEKTPLGKYAQNKGLDVVLLDEENPFYDALIDDYTLGASHLPRFAERQDQFNRKREGLWIADKIKASPEINASLLTSGQEHVENRFGLVDRLLDRNIAFNIIPCDYAALGRDSTHYVLQKFPPNAIEGLLMKLRAWMKK